VQSDRDMTIDWSQLLIPQTPLLELVLRGTIMYLVLFAALRVLVRRHIGSMSLMDLLLLVLIADAAQNAMASEYKSITEGLVLCATLVGWNYLLDWLAYRYDWMARVLEPSPLPVVRNGRMQRRNMRQELLTEDDLRSQLRQQGIEDLRTVKLAYVEPDGGVSVIDRVSARRQQSRTVNSKKQRGAV
jgi:uncharacterized membrane protein YcaP (DUF421 family)